MRKYWGSRHLQEKLNSLVNILYQVLYNFVSYFLCWMSWCTFFQYFFSTFYHINNSCRQLFKDWTFISKHKSYKHKAQKTFIFAPWCSMLRISDITKCVSCKHKARPRTTECKYKKNAWFFSFLLCFTIMNRWKLKPVALCNLSQKSLNIEWSNFKL